MEISTVLLIVLAAIAALIIVFYQYFYKNPRKGRQRIFLAFFRFVALFGGLLLLVNPKFVKKDFTIEKSNLIVLVDDSESMQEAITGISTPEISDRIIGDQGLKDRYNVQSYAFGTAIQSLDTIKFDQKNTNISNALETIDEIYVGDNSAVVLLTDGNQTLGREYNYSNLSKNTAVYPVVIGDTTAFEDISIGLLNTNSYAFLRNKFPIETTILYRGSNSISKTVTINLDGRTVHRERLTFDAVQNSRTLEVLAEANTVGVKSVRIIVESLDNEKNTFNNQKETAIEVIDEKTNIALISDMLHPDLGAIKKSIESNEQRSVTILNPSTVDQLEDFQIFILYQPNQSFREVFNYLENVNANKFTIAGRMTSWNFLNRAQNSYFKEDINQTEEMIPVINNAFGTFGLGEFNVDEFPPLTGNLGDIEIKKSSNTLMFQQIRGITLESPLFSIITEGNQKEAVLFGEDIWKWRAQTFRNTQSFQLFDDFMGRLMVYLSSDGQKSRLDLDYERVFDNAAVAKIRAYYVDQSFQFDDNANLTIKVEGKDQDFVRDAPMLLKGGYYEVDLSDLEAGEYSFTVTVEEENLKRSGSFKILDFNQEKQLLAADYGKLQKLAENTKGKVYMPDQVETLVDSLLTLEQYRPVQKSTQNVVSLIDFRILLGLIVLALSLEWFIRKYNGLI
ncbi:VWA domain-containing protein [Flagellimonas nanhaiensis]|uniref:VWA domain-containing protein n=1 Tax=Flagellimonas nanhaiensis TaxID=2292706 RepID=A0A371JUZ2_9FLAO|nr:VWA domain-containing protein [Allomuricauda nanhaiensis]RDY61629.1 VWA domain-containing protein [Allomuricauda nanhaiensis]